MPKLRVWDVYRDGRFVDMVWMDVALGEAEVIKALEAKGYRPGFRIYLGG